MTTILAGVMIAAIIIGISVVFLRRRHRAKTRAAFYAKDDTYGQL